MPRSQYQPTRDMQMSSAQEVHYSRLFKQADTAAGFRRQRVKQAERNEK